MRTLLAPLVGLVLSCGANAAAIPGQGTWETTLQPRDINHDGVVDAYYDTDLAITWLADANRAATNGDPGNPFGEPGLLDPTAVDPYLASLNLYGVTGWRLPSVQQVMPVGPDLASTLELLLGSGAGMSFQPDPSFSEMAHLYYVTLGNANHAAVRNTANFLNVMDGFDYREGPWCDPTTSLPLCGLTYFSMATGDQRIDGQGLPAFVWAVHDGDVAAIPEPSTFALLGVALLALWGTSQRRKER